MGQTSSNLAVNGSNGKGVYELSPVTDRVAKIREKYRTTRPSICISRYKIVTEFYMENPQLQGILKRAKNFRNICEKLPVLINEDEVIVGWQASKYRACALYPEMSFGWFLDELKAGPSPKGMWIPTTLMIRTPNMSSKPATSGARNA